MGECRQHRHLGDVPQPDHGISDMRQPGRLGFPARGHLGPCFVKRIRLMSCRSVFPFPSEIGHLQGLEMIIHEMELSLAECSVLIQNIAQPHRAFAKLLESVHFVLVLRLRHLTRCGSRLNLNSHTLPPPSFAQRSWRYSSLPDEATVVPRNRLCY